MGEYPAHFLKWGIYHNCTHNHNNLHLIIVIFVSYGHPEKAPLPIEVTVFGIVIFVSDEHPEKA